MKKNKSALAMKWMMLPLLLLTFSFGARAEILPPDSTNSVFQKGTAQYFIGEGKRYYNEGKHRLAIVKFREALLKDKQNAVATYWLAECHLALGDYEQARDFGEEAVALNPDVFKESSNLLGIAYHRLGNLDKALDHYKKALAMLSPTMAKDLLVQRHIDECERAKTMMASPVKVTITNMPQAINSTLDDYGPVLSPDGKMFYFVSRRSDNKGGGINPDDNRYFEDIYISFKDEQTGEWTPATNTDELLKRLNTAGFDHIAGISPDGEDLYLTINTTSMEKPKPKTHSSDLFISRMSKNGQWNTPKPVGKPVNTIFFEASPTVTADGRIMYFISERAGGHGGSDIYITYKTGNEWAKPQNLGDIINTSGQETTCYITPDDKYLFFSSTGHDGMGGYDIYVTRKDNGRWLKPVNLGYPINTVSDETHFAYYPELKKAYYSTFSSAANKGVGARDIFEVDMSEYELP